MNHPDFHGTPVHNEDASEPRLTEKEEEQLTQFILFGGMITSLFVVALVDFVALFSREAAIVAHTLMAVFIVWVYYMFFMFIYGR